MSKQRANKGQALVEWITFCTLAMLITLYGFSRVLKNFKHTLAVRQSVFMARKKLSNEPVEAFDFSYRSFTLENGIALKTRYDQESGSYIITYPKREKAEAFPLFLHSYGW